MWTLHNLKIWMVSRMENKFGQKHYDDLVKALTGPGAMMNSFTSEPVVYRYSVLKRSQTLNFNFCDGNYLYDLQCILSVLLTSSHLALPRLAKSLAPCASWVSTAALRT